MQRWQDSLAPTRNAHGATVAARAFRCLRSALSDAERMGMIARNPAKAARPAQRSRNKRPGFTLSQAQAVIVAAEGERLAPLFGFILHSGFRDAEALGLRWGDVDLDHGIVSVRQNMVRVGGQMVAGRPKTARSARTFAMLPQAAEDLRQQKAQQAHERLRAGEGWRDAGLVFAADNGAPLHIGNVDRAFRRVRDEANKKACKGADKDPSTENVIPKLPLYSMRHAAASILLNSGVPVAVAAKMMGHSVDMFCETYADLLVEATRDAAAQAGAFLAAHTPKPEEKPAVVPLRRGRRRATAGA